MCIGSDVFITYPSHNTSLKMATKGDWCMYEVYNIYNVINSHIFTRTSFYSHSVVNKIKRGVDISLHNVHKHIWSHLYNTSDDHLT